MIRNSKPHMAANRRSGKVSAISDIISNQTRKVTGTQNIHDDLSTANEQPHPTPRYRSILNPLMVLNRPNNETIVPIFKSFNEDQIHRGYRGGRRVKFLIISIVILLVVCVVTAIFGTIIVYKVNTMTSDISVYLNLFSVYEYSQSNSNLYICLPFNCLSDTIVREEESLYVYNALIDQQTPISFIYTIIFVGVITSFSGYVYAIVNVRLFKTNDMMYFIRFVSAPFVLSLLLCMIYVNYDKSSGITTHSIEPGWGSYLFALFPIIGYSIIKFSPITTF